MFRCLRLARAVTDAPCLLPPSPPQLHANQNVSNYWVRANPNFGTTGFADGINSAILRYDGAPVAEPAPSDPPASVKPLVETDLHPLARMPVVCPAVMIALNILRLILLSSPANHSRVA